LAKHDGDLWLNGITELSDDAAEVLARHQGSLGLDGLTKLTSAGLAKRFVKDETTSVGGVRTIDLDNISELSTAAAAELIKSPSHLNLDALAEVSDELAEVLSKQPGGSLSLKSLTRLTSARLASRLTKSRDAELNQLTELSASAAKALADGRTGVFLNGLKEISDEAALALAKKPRGVALELHGLEKLTHGRLAQRLATGVRRVRRGCPNNTLEFPDLKNLSDAAAEGLAKSGRPLAINRLPELTDAQAEAFAKHRGGLSLGGLRSLTDAQAEALAKHDGDLSLDGITELSDAQIEAFATVGHSQLSLKGLTELSDDAAKKLRARRKIIFPENLRR
jgi:hypothetical protein